MIDLAALSELVDQLDDPNDDTDDLDDLIDTWDMLDTIARNLTVHVRTWNTAAANRLADLDYDPKHGYQSHGGVIVHHRQTSTDRWDGERVLSALAHDIIEPATGELVPAVPVEVLADVIPAIRGRSSRWLVKGLEVHGLDPDRFRERQWGVPTISRGGKR